MFFIFYIVEASNTIYNFTKKFHISFINVADNFYFIKGKGKEKYIEIYIILYITNALKRLNRNQKKNNLMKRKSINKNVVHFCQKMLLLMRDR